jgi:hypothetical protein
MKIPIVREHGSWAVFIFSSAAGITIGLMTRPWQTGREFSLVTLLTVLGLVLLINSKNPLLSAVRSQGGRREHLLWFGVFGSSGLILLSPFLIEGLKHFFIFSLLILSYVILLFRGREHDLLTEINGFALLSLSAPIIYFVITGDLSLRLYSTVFLFFAAGVFKVRARLKKTAPYRWIMVFYCIFSLPVFYFLLEIPVIVLLPFLENVISVARMRDEKLRTTGNTELIKGIIFTILLGYHWQ